MTRRDRTTGKPRHRPKQAAERAGTRRMAWTAGYTRFVILGVAALLLVAVLGLVGYRWYDDNIGKPRETVLQVEDQSFSLGYFTDRLGAFSVSNPNLREGFREPALLTRIEEEAVMVRMAEERGYDLSDQAVFEHIAEDLGVEYGGADSPFDSLYRSRLRQSGLSESDYRRLSRAGLAEQLLIDEITENLGETGETYELRVILLRDEESAEEVVARIEDGEDMETVAGEASLDPQSREEGGMLPPTPPRLLPEVVQDAAESAGEGGLVGPLDVEGNWWVFRVEDIDEAGTIAQADRETLAARELEDLIEEAKENLDIERSLSDEQIRWAYRNASVPGGN